MREHAGLNSDCSVFYVLRGFTGCNWFDRIINVTLKQHRGQNGGRAEKEKRCEDPREKYPDIIICKKSQCDSLLVSTTPTVTGPRLLL